MPNKTFTNLEDRMVEILEDLNQKDLSTISIHKEKRSDQEGTIDVVKRVFVSNRPDLISEFIKVYRNADKRDKVFIEAVDGGWTIKHQSRDYISS